MELNFNELDDLNNYNTSQSSVGNTNSYWENPKESTNSKKKRVTYDDILSSLNLVVNQNGVLQYMTIKPNNDLFLQNPREPPKQPPKQAPKQAPKQTSQVSSKPFLNSKPLEPEVKNSYIFNKYFKDYKDTNNNIQIDEPKRPQTIEEYNRMVFDERVKRMKERNRVAQIKSTKLLFENNSTIYVSKNNLYRMSFK